MKKLYFIYLLTIAMLTISSCFLGGCSTPKTLKQGCYQLVDNDSMLKYNVELKGDTTYVFNDIGDMFSLSLKGRWKIKGNKLILNSIVQADSKASFEAATISNEDGAAVMLYDVYGDPLSDQSKVYIKVGTAYSPLSKKEGNIYRFKNAELPVKFIIGVGNGYKEAVIDQKDTKTDQMKIYMIPDTKGAFHNKKQFLIQDSISFKTKNLVFKKVACKVMK